MARQRYCRRLARYRNTLRVSADPVAKPAVHTRPESRSCRSSKGGAGERLALSAGEGGIRTLGPRVMGAGDSGRRVPALGAVFGLAGAAMALQRRPQVVWPDGPSDFRL